MRYVASILVAFLLSLSASAQVAPITGPTITCMARRVFGVYITLSDATPGGTWTCSDYSIASLYPSGASCSINGFGGTVTITYKVGSDSATMLVAFAEYPAEEGAIIGGGTYCTGGSGAEAYVANYTDPNYMYYLYNNVGTAVDSMQGNGAWAQYFPPATVGIYTVTAVYSAGGVTGCATVLGSASIDTVAPPILFTVTGGGTYCGSGPVGLSSSQTGVHYQLWDGTSAISSSVTGTGTALSFTADTSGTFIVAATNSGCTDTMTGNALLTVNPIPVISGPGRVCDLDTVSLASSVPGSSWSSSNTAVATVGSAGLLSAVSAGVDTITCTVQATGCYKKRTDTVIALCTGTPAGGSATVNASLVCYGSTITLGLSGASAGCGITYQWQSSTDNVTYTDMSGATATTDTLTPTSSLYYRCKVLCTATGLYSYSAVTHAGVHSTIIQQNTNYACGGDSAYFFVVACGYSPSYNLTTWFGDGTSVNTPFTLAYGATISQPAHAYVASGTYTVKQVLYIGTVALDSVTFTYQQTFCNVLPVSFYFDANSDSVFDTGDLPLPTPALTEVDSNGIPIDSISTTSGFYYNALGGPGTMYKFRVVVPPPGMHISSPASGVVSDSIEYPFPITFDVQQIGLNCAPGAHPALKQFVATNTGRHLQTGQILISRDCIPEKAHVILHFSPRYNFTVAYPTPTSHSGTTAIWDLNSIPSNNLNLPIINYQLTVPGAWLLPGDTVKSTFITIDTGIVDTFGYATKIDTVKASYDPNEMSVFPAGSVLPCTKLQYTISFSNTGNDTAHNITILDTLSNNLDVNTFNMEAASSVMNISMLKNSSQNIVKFDLPGINLLDSAHSLACTGMIVFDIKTKSGLADGSPIFNSANIIFDDNPIVATNVVENVSGISAITGNNPLCVAAFDTLTNLTTGGVWSISNGHVTGSAGIYMGVSAGADTITYTVSNTCATRSASMVVTVNPLPHAGTVTGLNSVCQSASITLADTTAGGSWSSSNPAIAAVSSGGIVTGASAGTATVSYTTSNSCGNAATTEAITVNALPVAQNVTGGGGYCAGGSGVHIGLSGSSLGINYTLYNGVSSVTTVAGTGSPIDFGALTAAGTYTVSATNAITSCRNNMTGSESIIINPLPNAFTVTGGGSYCAGSAGVHIGLSGSASGVNYTLYRGASPVTTVAGTGSPIDFGAMTAAGTYTVTATNPITTCQSNMSGSKSVTVNPLPAVHNVTGGGAYCAGGPGLHIGLDGSDTGITYTLLNGLSVVGTSTGTGGSLDFGLQIAAGTYTVVASNPATACQNNMAGSKTISVNLLPNSYSVTGGGSYCAGGPGMHIGLGSSDTGIVYTLLKGTSPISTFPGTGSSLDFGLQAAAGTYTVSADNPATSCQNNMTGSETITVSSLPTSYSVTGGGSYCAGGMGLHVGLSGSNTGVTYSLYRDSVALGTFAGTGGALDMGVQTSAGTYTVVASNYTTTCTKNMGGSASVAINPLPATYNVTGGGSYCAGSTGVHVGLSGSDTGITYALYGDSIAHGIFAGTGAALDMGAQTTAGTYTVVAINNASSCTNAMAGRATVIVNPLPFPYTMTGGGNYCAGGTGVHIGINGSDTGINYTLYISTAAIGTFTGTGAIMDLGLQTAQGTYTIAATNNTTSCTNILAGSATVAINPIPTAYTVVGGGSYCAGGAGVHIGLSSSDTGVLYTLYRGGLAAGTLAGNGTTLDFGLKTDTGTYTATATNTTTTCSNNMLGGAAIATDALPAAYAVTGGGSYCAGSTGVHIGLNGSQTGTTYTLYFGTSAIGTYPGTDRPLDLGLHTGAGTYTVTASNIVTSCMNNMTGSTTIAVNPLPHIYAVTGGGSYCAGAAGVHVGLSASDTGIRYILYRGSTAVSTLSGSGSILDFGLQAVAGTYTVSAENAATSCTNMMTDSATVGINLPPTTFTVVGGGHYCAGMPDVHIGLNGSQAGATYTLYLATTPIGTLAGTGAAIDFGLETIAGTYTATASNDTTLCGSSMTGSVGVMVDPLPSSYSVTGGGSYCAGGTGVGIALSGSETSTIYTLYHGSAAVDSFIGTGRALALGTYTNAGTYTVSARNRLTSCINNMPGTAVIAINPLPAVYSVTGGGSYCDGGFGVPVGLGGSETNVNYTLHLGTATARVLPGTGYALDFGRNTAAGIYTVTAVSTASCSNNMVGSANVAITPTVTPAVSLAATPGAIFCPGNTVTITPTTTNGGTIPIYNWDVNSVNMGRRGNYTYKPADGDVVSVVVTSNELCARPRTAYSAITLHAVPNLNPSVEITSGTGFTIMPGQAITLAANAMGTGLSLTYQWVVNGTYIAGATNNTFTGNSFANNDSVTCIITTTNSCGEMVTAASSVILTVNTTGIGTVTGSNSNIRLLPNPNNGTFVINGALSITNAELTTTITDMLGKTIFTGTVTVKDGIINQQISLGNSLADGTYLLALRSDAYYEVLHFVINK